LVGQYQQGGVKKSISARRAPERVTVTHQRRRLRTALWHLQHIGGSTEYVILCEDPKAMDKGRTRREGDRRAEADRCAEEATLHYEQIDGR